MSKIIIIGAGFSGLSASAYLSAAGHEVHVFEKNESVGGRARQFSTESGYVFDMGPSWYWMPEVFENFFAHFGFSTSDFYDLKLLNPSFDVVYSENETLSIPANFDELCLLFEAMENGSASRLRIFMTEAESKYKLAMENLVHKPGLSITEFADSNLWKGLFLHTVFSSLSKHVHKYFKHPKLIVLMEFPVLFLGATPQKTPALYSLMNYAGLKLGTWYPQGGFGAVTNAMRQLAEKQGAVFHLNATVEEIEIKNNQAVSVKVNGEKICCDVVIASADYAHVENKLLPKPYRNYDQKYWEQKTFAPSCLIFYVGISKKINTLNHHTLFFDENLDQHSLDIYSNPKWPANPLFYLCCPSKSDNSVAPLGHENLFLLMPIASGLKDTDEIRESYFKKLIARIEIQTKEKLWEYIDYKKSYCINDFVFDYNAYKGNAYGLANTLNQTAVFKPKIRNKKINNIYYAGQLTVPGPGVPPSIISGKIVAKQVISFLAKTKL